MNYLFSKIFKVIILFYKRAISPFFISRCRFKPTCSTYALKAIDKYGPWKGVWLTLKRIFKCHPFGGEGYDPIP